MAVRRDVRRFIARYHTRPTTHMHLWTRRRSVQCTHTSLSSFDSSSSSSLLICCWFVWDIYVCMHICICVYIYICVRGAHTESVGASATNSTAALRTPVSAACTATPCARGLGVSVCQTPVSLFVVLNGQWGTVRGAASASEFHYITSMCCVVLCCVHSSCVIACHLPPATCALRSRFVQ